MSESRSADRQIAFSFIGGVHQFMHGAPVAAALARRPGVEVTAYVTCARNGDSLRLLLDELDGNRAKVAEMALPASVEMLAGTLSGSKALKSARLSWWSRTLRSADCIVALERTSTVLTRLPGYCPPLVHIPHGVGGARRAGGDGIDRRFADFDLALLAGEADREATLALGLLAPERVQVVGQIKIAGLQQLGLLQRHRLFANDRPTVLYNPHFHPRRGSWKQLGYWLMESLRVSRQFNLIIAPHMRLFKDVSDVERDRLQSLADPDWLIVDIGSERSTDMTYTLGAEIYLGDFSSQVYEWLVFPRPCVFFDQVGDGGVDDTNLPKMWSLGETVSTGRDVLKALSRAMDAHPRFVARQHDVMLKAVGDLTIPAHEIAADSILRLIDQFRKPSGRSARWRSRYR